jgi:hypothetical protein
MLKFSSSWTILAFLMVASCDSGGSDAVSVVVTTTVAGAPTIGIATAGNGSATIAFTAPTSNGGATITGYSVTCTAGTASVTATGTTSPISVTGLTNGTAYSCTIVATNSVGNSAASSAVSVTPVGVVTVAGAPTIGTAIAGNGSASIAFTAPTSNGGATITAYTATCTATGQTTRTGTATSSPIAVSTLTNGTAYSCAVTATNSAGVSTASAAVSVTPTATATGGLPAAFGAFGANVKVVYNSTAGTVSLEATGRPDHKSPYWNPNNSSGLYEAPGSETTVAAMSPGYIESYTNKYYLTVNANPTTAANTTATSLGAIGIAITGSPIFNGQEGPNVNLDSGTISGFDKYGAHTGPQVYHYHLEPTPISNNDTALVAILRDGFFLYGRKCDSTGAAPTNLDYSGGHTSTTQYSSTPVYHYHISNSIYLTVNNKAAYLLFPGTYKGTPTTIAN